MMKKKNLFTGSVFEFYVPEIKKYAYCKFFDFTAVSSFDGLLAQVFDFFSDDQIDGIDVLSKCDWLSNARCMHAWPDLRKKTGWKSIGIHSASNDHIIPDFKSAQTAVTVVEDESKIGPWHAIHQLTQRGPNCRYEQVRHLEQPILTTASLGLSWRTGMEYCRNYGMPIEDYYDLNDKGKRNMYYQMINVPPYKDIPNAIRGKALCN